MRIVLVTPLYPPEIVEPAPYVKELAKRLSGRHTVTILTYTRLPEKVAGVRIIAIDKRRPLLLRLVSFFFALVRAARSADVVYAMNGASVELPLALASFFISSPVVIRIGDAAAHERTKKNQLAQIIERFAFSRARRVIADGPRPRPELLPFAAFPNEALDAHGQSWNSHLRTLEDIFNHAVS